jgi:hypothetical protein
LDYNWNVYAYLELLFWQNDRDAIPALKRARALLSLEELERWHGQNDPQPLIDYLEARDPADRLAAAMAFAKRRRVEQAWLKDVADALVMAGVKPEDCRMLLDVNQRRR